MFVGPKIKIAQRYGQNGSLGNSLNLFEEMIVNTDVITMKMGCEGIDELRTREDEGGDEPRYYNSGRWMKGVKE